MLMRMKRIFAFDLGEFEILSVELRDDFRSPMLAELREFLIYVDGLVQFNSCHSGAPQVNPEARVLLSVFRVR